MEVTKDYVMDLLDRMGKSKGRNAKMHKEWFDECSHRNEDNSIKICII